MHLLQICAISKDHGAEIYLNKGARKIATDLMERKTLMTEKSKQVKGLQSVSSAYLKVHTVVQYECTCVTFGSSAVNCHTTMRCFILPM